MTTPNCCLPPRAPRRRTARRSPLAVLASALALCGLVGGAGSVLSGCGSTDGRPDTSAARLVDLSNLRRATVTANGRQFVTWIADNPRARGEGMQFVEDFEVRPNQGMLFVYPNENFRSFFGRDVKIPLDLAFLNAAGRVLSVHRINPDDETPLDSAGPAKYALELKAGTFASAGIRVGTVVTIPEFADDTATDGTSDSED